MNLIPGNLMTLFLIRAEIVMHSNITQMFPKICPKTPVNLCTQNLIADTVFDNN